MEESQAEEQQLHLVGNPAELNRSTQTNGLERTQEQQQTDQSEEQHVSHSEEQDEQQQLLQQQQQEEQRQQEQQPEEEIPLVERRSQTDENLEEKSIEEDPPPYSQLPQHQQQPQPFVQESLDHQQQRLYEDHQLHQHVQQQLRIQQHLIDQSYQEQLQLRQQQSPEQSPFRVLQPSRSTPSRDWSQSLHERVHSLQQVRRRTTVRKRGIICCGISGALLMAMGFNFIFLDLQDDEDGLSVVLVIGSVFMVFGVMLILSCLRLCCMTRLEQSFTPIEDLDQDVMAAHDSYNDVSTAYNYHQSLPSYSALPMRQGGNYHLISGVPSAPAYRYPDDDRPPSYSEIFKDS